MRTMTVWALAGLLVGMAPAAVASCTQGTVWEDRNGDGRRSGDEPGLAGVRVSDGRQIATTAADGRYRLPQAPDGPVFVIKPASHVLPARGDGLPDFWRAADGGQGCDFALEPAPPRAEGLEVLVFADPQPATREQVGWYARTIVEPLRGRHGARLGVSLGDITNDDPALYPDVVAATSRLGVPWLNVPGNHDLDFDADDAGSLRSYGAVFGPDTFAWEESEAVFVGLDDVIYQPGSRPAYVGGLRDAQFAFLEQFLPTVPRDRLLVLMLHIPLFDTAREGGAETFRSADRERLFALLEDTPRVLVLSAHRHQLEHRFHGPESGWHGARPLHEFNVGAASGAFWSGVADADGIPDTTMADGTPNGHATLWVDGDGYRLGWQPSRVGDDPAFTRAMRLHAPKVLRQGAYPAWGVYANVFMGLADTRVEFRVDGSEWRPMVRVHAPDPWLQAENARDDLATTLRGFDRSPEATPSTHLWRGALPTGLDAGTHQVEVRAFDQWQGEQRARTEYRLDQVQVPPGG